MYQSSSTILCNPYVAGNPVGGSPAFIGRADILREVFRVLRRPQDSAIVLYGQRRVGKTSILQQLEAQLPGEGLFYPVYFDLEDKAAWSLRRVLLVLATTIAHALGYPNPDLGSEPEITFHREWLPAVLRGLSNGSSLVLLFDEFDVLSDPRAEQAATVFFPYLRSLLTFDSQRLKFVFVIGRDVNDLTSIALSLFKGTPTQHISLMRYEDMGELVCLSEKNGTLTWSADAVEEVWQWTHGHPFLTQQLCSYIWERAYGEGPQERPTVTPTDVNAAIPDALEASRSAMEWLWDGLPPAERVVISALAEAGPGSITRDDLEHLLRESGVRVVVRELQNAPQLLQDWDLIEPINGSYQFRVNLLRRWIAQYKPLHRVQAELDYIEPAAESLYQAGLSLYHNGKLSQAAEPLRQAVALNPHHMRANELLADILLALHQPEEARKLLEQIYSYQPGTIGPRLVQALLLQAQNSPGSIEQLQLFERIREIAPDNQEVIGEYEGILEQARTLLHRRKSDEARSLLEQLHKYRPDLACSDLIQATLIQGQRSTNDVQRLSLYKRVLELDPSQSEAVAEVAEIERRMSLGTQLQKLHDLEQEKKYADALHLARELENEYSDMREWKPDLDRLERKTHLSDLYQKGLEALQSRRWRAARTFLEQVVALEPMYDGARRYLDTATAAYEQTVRIQRKWLINALTWLPLFLLTFALGLGTLPIPTDSWPPLAYLLISDGIILLWLANSSWRKMDYESTSQLIIASVLLSVGVVILLMPFIIASPIHIIVAGIIKTKTLTVLSGVVALILTIAIDAVVGVLTYGIAYIVASIVMALKNVGVSAIGTVVIVATISEAIGMTHGVAEIMIFSILAIIETILPSTLVGSIIEKALKTHHLSWFNGGVLMFGALGYLYLIWYSFLGGWRA